jgi:hypothetical protein
MCLSGLGYKQTVASYQKENKVLSFITLQKFINLLRPFNFSTIILHHRISKFVFSFVGLFIRQFTD